MSMSTDMTVGRKPAMRPAVRPAVGPSAGMDLSTSMSLYTVECSS